MTKRHLAALAAVALATGIVGCGGGDDDDGGGGGGAAVLKDFATGPLSAVPAVASTAATRTQLRATAGAQEVETDGSWVVWRDQQVDVGYYDGSAFRYLNLGIDGANSPYASAAPADSPIAFDGTRVAFLTRDVGAAARPVLRYGSAGGALSSLSLPSGVAASQPLETFRTAITADVVGVWDLVADKLYVAHLADAAPALAELAHTGDIVGAPGNGLLPISNAGALELLDLADGTVKSLTGDGAAGSPPTEVRFANGAFTWVEGGKAYFYAAGFSPGDDSQLIANSASPQSNPVSGPYSTYVLWQEGTVVRQRPWTQLGQAVSTPPDTSVVIRSHPTLLATIGSLANVETGLGFIAWLGGDANGDTQLFTYYVGQPPPSPSVVQVTSDAGSGAWPGSTLWLRVDGSAVFFTQEFANAMLPGSQLKRFDYGGTVRTLVAGDAFQELPAMRVAGGKAIVLARDHSARLFAKRADAAGAPIVVTPRSHDVASFSVGAGRLVYAAIDHELYRQDEILRGVVTDRGGAGFLAEVYGHDLNGGGEPRRLTWDAAEDVAPATDGTWVVWNDELGWALAMDLETGGVRVIGESDGAVHVSGGVAAWRDPTGEVYYADLVAGDAARIGGGATSSPAVAGRVVAWPAADGAHYYDLAATAPADTTIPESAGVAPSGAVATDGRFVAWREVRVSWDDDGSAGTPRIDANVVVVHDLDVGTSSDVPAADFARTGFGLTGGDEGPVTDPVISGGVVAFGAIEYGAANANGDMEVFFFDAAAASPALVRVTDDGADPVWDGRVRVGGNLAVWCSGGASGWGWEGAVPAVSKLK